MDYQDLINQAYQAFNARNIDGVLALMHPDVQWPNGWEGGYVYGHDEVRTYWLRQWEEIDPEVIPVSIHKNLTGQIDVQVHQIVKDRLGRIITDDMIRHLYTLEEGKIKKMVIKTL